MQLQWRTKKYTKQFEKPEEVYIELSKEEQKNLLTPQGSGGDTITVEEINPPLTPDQRTGETTLD